MSGIIYDVAGVKVVWIRRLLMFNPVTIVVDGYRNTFVKQIWFWENLRPFRNFAIVYGIMLLLALWSYSRLRKDIPDML